MARDFSVIVSTLPGLLDAAVPIAAARSGGVGVLDLEHAAIDDRALAAVTALARRPRGWIGVKIDGSDPAAAAFLHTLSIDLHVVIVARPDPSTLGPFVREWQRRGATVLAEVTRAGDADVAEACGAGGVVAKGHEAGGWVGDETTFILLQRLIARRRLPVWAHGGIGRHTAAACHAAGAAGVVVDSQVALVRESALDEAARAVLARLDGSETVCIGGEIDAPCRVLFRPGCRAVNELRRAAAAVALPDAAAREAWRREVRSRIGWQSLERDVWMVGQDVAFAAPLAEIGGTVGGVVAALHDAVESHARAARASRPLAEHAPLARSHGTRFPIVQGPMTRVSDCAPFAAAVAEGGGLPFLALALMRANEVDRLLKDVRAQMQDRPWGVGILGFVPLDLREEQLEVVRRFRPPFALIAGGRPDQARVLEEQGIATYLHVPSPALLRMFVDGGARRFVFEGRECGGHVGPRSSFVLWETMVDVLLESLGRGGMSDCHVLFAGGIHDALSGAMVAALAAPLAERGARVGVLLGTAYLFTREAVEAGAVVDLFQQQALQCTRTVLLETGPGHAIRCVETPYGDFFESEKQRLSADGRSAEEVRVALEALNVGRLRIASKGVTRNPAHAADPSAPRLIPVPVDEQRRDGMYMIGQVAALRHEPCTIASLHHEVSADSSALIAALEDSSVRAPAVASHPERADIAIVGMSCLLPKAPNLETYWDNILNKVDAITEVPSTRWDWRRYFDQDPKAADKIVSRWGGFLEDVPFDPILYGMPPSSLRSIEPLQLLTLEAVRVALEDAGCSARPLRRDRTAVVIGAGGGIADLGQQYAFRSALPMFLGEASDDLLARLPEWTEDSFAGLLVNVAAGRVANRFDLGGPNFTVDAACASSLAAAYLGVRELADGTSDVAIVGGADTVQNPFAYTCFSKTHALSPRGRCRPFDASADGISISEGVGIVVLKRLADAERDGDRIYAVLKAVAGASDGRGKGLTAPRPEGQVRALERAYAAAGVAPSTVRLIEAHGTGTVVGDRAEIEALTTVFGSGRNRQACAIGSVKSMIGHTKCTAGLASLIKVALALHHRILPPTIGVEEPNPSARFPDSPFFVNTEATPWWSGAAEHPRRAGVSAFGFGGTNFHAVLEEYAPDDAVSDRRAPLERWPAELIVFSGSRTDIQAQAKRLAQALERGAKPALRELALALWRSARERLDDGRALALAIVADSLDDLARKLNVFGERAEETADLRDARGIYYAEQPLGRSTKLAVLFPGQGSQYPNMLRDLFVAFPELRAHVEAADRALVGRFEGPLSALMFPRPCFTEAEDKAARQALMRTNVAQPALAAADMAAFHLVESMGVTPDLLAGHSFGEYVALCAAGAMSEEALVRVSEGRARLILDAAGAELGSMAAVDADETATLRALDGIDGVWISNLNSPRQTIVSGTSHGLQRAMERLSASGLHASAVAAGCAFHSPVIAGAREPLAALVGSIEWTTPRVPVFSNTFARPYPSSAGDIVDLLSRHLVERVDFRGEVEAMYAAGARVFLEVGPRSTLSGLVDQILANRPHLAVSLDAAGRPGLVQFQHALARLMADGIRVDLDRLFAGRAGRAQSLDALLEHSRERPHDARMWLVNGGRARPASEPAMPIDSPRPVPAPVPRTNAPAQGDAVMRQFQTLMNEFLETERRVMLAYLRGTADGAAAPAESLTAERLPARVGAEKAAAPEPPPIPVLPSIRAADPLDADALERKLLEIVTERTGYPADMLNLDANIEADLGIDSIKRVEILAAFQKACLPADRAHHDLLDRLSGVKTLRSILATVSSLRAASTDEQEAPLSTAASPDDDDVALPRLEFALREAPAVAEPLHVHGAVVVTDDEGGVADAVASELRAMGVRGVLVRARNGASESGDRFAANLVDPEAVAELVRAIKRRVGAVAGLVHLLPLQAAGPGTDADLESCKSRIAADVKSLFHLARELRGDLVRGDRRPAGWLLAATTEHAFSGAVPGLMKTLATEMPDVRCRVVQTERVAPTEAARQIVAEMTSADRELVITYRGSTRMAPRPEPAPFADGLAGVPPIDGSSIVLVTGGARGITAEVTRDVAKRYRPTLIVLGRSPIPDAEERTTTVHLTAKRALKAALIEELQREGVAPTPPQVEAAYTALVRAREIRASLQQMASCGARVIYRTVDVRDDAAFRSAIQEIYRSHARIDGVIHGAGIIEDKLFHEKSAASFDRVFDTKVDSALVLARELRPETLKFLVFFSSVAGSFGSRGQCDYTAANGLINTLARHLDRQWPGRVVAINWGPWLGVGMVSPQVQRQFIARGIRLVPPAAGRRAFDEELRRGRKGQVEVIVGWGPWVPGEIADAPPLPATLQVSI